MTAHSPVGRNKALKRAYENLRTLVKEFQANLQLGADSETDYHYIYIQELGQVTLSKDEAVKYFTCVHDLYNSLTNKHNFDQRTITSKVNEVILRALDPRETQPSVIFKKRLNSALEALADALHAPPDTWEVHYIVEGISLKRSPFKIGKVEFYTGNKRQLKTLLDRVDHLYSNSSYPLAQRRAFAKSVKRNFKKYFSKKVIAIATVKASTSTAASNQALRELRSTLDALNFYADMLHPPGIAARAYLPGDAHRDGAFSPAFRLDGSGDGYTAIFPTLYAVGPLANLELSQERAATLSKLGFQGISKILLKEDQERTSFERRILSAFQWAGRATLVDLSNKMYKENLDSRREEAFLLYTISLECLLLREKSENNTAHFKTSTRPLRN